MKLTRKKLKKLILEIVDGLGKEIIPLPVSFKDVSEVDAWVDKAFKNTKVGAGKYTRAEISDVDKHIGYYRQEFERAFAFGDPDNESYKMEYWGNKEHQEKYPNDPLPNLSDEKINFYNEFAKKALKAGVKPGRSPIVKSAEERNSRKRNKS